MITVAIPLFQSSTSIGIVGPMDVLAKACLIRNNLRNDGNGTAFFRVQLVGLNSRPVVYPNGVTLRPHTTASRCRKPDVVLVPSVDEDLAGSLPANRAFVPWLRGCHERGSTMASLCTGAFMLAEAGVLAGKSATTHWFFAEEFGRRYPGVRLLRDRVIVDEGNVITSGAATSFLNLALYLVEKYCGHEVAVMSSKLMLIDLGKQSQLPYAMFIGASVHGDPSIRSVQQFLEQEFAQPLSLSQIASVASMSARNLLRRFKHCTGDSPTAYLQRIRIEAARRKLENGAYSVDQIRYQVGYEDPRSFRRLFKRYTGLTPKEYRARFAPMDGKQVGPAQSRIQRPRTS